MPRIKRLREGRRTKLVDRTLNKDSVVKKTVKFDCALASVAEGADFSALATERFSGYKFTRKTTQNLLVWNDGLFWSWMNNFRELPLAASKLSNSTNDKKNAGFESNVMPQNRKLYGGCVTEYTQSAPDAVATGWGVDSPSELGDTKNDLELPILKVSSTNGLHQVSQSVNLKETWSQCVNDRIYHQINIRDFIAVPNSGLHYVDQMAEKLSALGTFAVRNIIVSVPSEWNWDEDMNQTAFADMVGHAQQERLEYAVMQILLKRAKGVYGKPEGTNSDLYRSINPRFKLLRDYITVYRPNQNQLMSQTKTSFYHRYDHNVKTECMYDSTVEPDVQLNASNVSQSDVQWLETCSSNLDGQANMIYTPKTDGPSFSPKGIPLQFKSDRSAEQAHGTQNYVAAEDDTEMAAQENDKILLFKRITEYAETNPIMQPKSHRIVWIRLPRFAHNVELADLNTEMYAASSWMSGPETRQFVDSCGLRVQGKACWTVMKPECSPSGGMSVPCPIDAVGSTGHQIETGVN